MNDYITLKTGDLSLVRQFKCLYQGAGWLRGRAQNRQRTVTGKLDVQEGAGGQRWSFAIRCPYSHNDTTWGDYLDLEVFADFTDGLYMIDHFGVEHEVVMINGQLEGRPLTSAVDGENIWITQVMFESVS